MEKKLYIIGNGFDLHHELRTSYLNFRDDYLLKRHSNLWKNLLEIYGDAPKQNDYWWKDFENMLGRADYANLAQQHNGLALGFIMVKKLLRGKLPPLFGEWIREVDRNIDLKNINTIIAVR